MVAWKVGVKAAEADCSRKDENIDLPDSRDERQQQRDRRSNQIHYYQEGSAGKLVGEGADNERDADIGYHLDGERGAEDDPSVRAGELKGQKAERYGQKPRADECNHLGKEKMAIGAAGKNGEHDRTL